MSAPSTLAGKRVWVAGHRGMVGSAIARQLAERDCEILTAARDDLDLLDQAATRAWVAEQRPDAIFLAAAKVGGIAANNDYPADFLYDNLMIQANVVEAAHRADCGKLVILGSSCIYPKFAEQPMREDALLGGKLEPTNQWYAIAKIAGIMLGQAYRAQHGRDFISAMPTNLYGIGDNYNLETSHVVPALIRKVHEAKLAGKSSVEIWGTGTPLREFLYADDCAEALIFLMEHYSGTDHINVGSGEEISIADLARTVCTVVGFKGELTFDASKPDGTPRKLMDSSRLLAMGWRPRHSLEAGLQLAYQDFLANHADAPQAAATGS